MTFLKVVMMSAEDRRFFCELAAFFYELLCHKLPPGADDAGRAQELRDFWIKH